MKVELQAEFFRRYPLFFRRPPVHSEFGDKVIADCEGPLDYRGIECGDGWFDLLNRLVAPIEAHIRELMAKGVPKAQWPRALEIKEKFGTLRVYPWEWAGVPEALKTALNQAEKESARTCEGCGDPGTMRTQESVWVACDSCFQKANMQSKSHFDMDAFIHEINALLASRAS